MHAQPGDYVTRLYVGKCPTPVLVMSPAFPDHPRGDYDVWVVTRLVSVQLYPNPPAGDDGRIVFELLSAQNLARIERTDHAQAQA